MSFEGDEKPPEQKPRNSHGQMLPIFHCIKSQGHQGGLVIVLPTVQKGMELGPRRA